MMWEWHPSSGCILVLVMADINDHIGANNIHQGSNRSADNGGK